MFQIIPIGEVKSSGNKVEVYVEKSFEKALLHVDLFSHVHILTKRSNVDGTMIYTRVCRIIEISKGTIIGECTEAYTGMEELVDIKPYFPCEDYVRSTEKCEMTKGELKPSLAITQDSTSQEERVIQTGVIRNVRGQIYIQFDEQCPITSGIIKVFWWFDKFDDKRFRKVTVSKPPYENAPESGIFATRSPVRPNPIAITVCKIKRIDEELKRVYINQIEAFDKTPCLGILPYDPDLDAIPATKTPKWLEHWAQYNMEIEKETNVGVTCPSDSSFEKESTDKNNGNGTIYVNQLLYPEFYEKAESCESPECYENSQPGSLQTEQNLSLIQKGNEALCKPDGITVHGAWENNLKGIDVCVPYGKITAVVGVSGSGKSSLVNDTIFAECRRRMEYLGNSQSRLDRPHVDEMTGCIPAVVISQNPIRGNSQSTIGTYTNAYDYLRMIYATIGTRFCPDCGNEIQPINEEKIVQIIARYSGTNIKIQNLQNKAIYTSADMTDHNAIANLVHRSLEIGKGAFYLIMENGERALLQTKQKCYRCNRLMFRLKPSTFNYSDGDSRCPKCNGTGFVVTPDINKIIAKPKLSLLDGASPFYGKLGSFIKNPNANWMKGQVFGLAEKMGEDLTKPWDELSEEFRNKILYGSEDVVSFVYDNKSINRKGEITRRVEGICSILERTYDENGAASAEAFMTKVPCDECKGERLNAEGRAVTVAKIRYPEAAAMSFRDLSGFLAKLQKQLPKEQLAQIENPLNNLEEVLEAARMLGVEYLNLDRCTQDISGGEGQRIKLLSALLNHMTGILYLFDEPSKGLHPKDYKRVSDMIFQMKREGNTIIMVEHNEDMIRIADNVIEIGPGAGKNGGNLTGEGSLSSMMEHMGTDTARYLGQNHAEQIKTVEPIVGRDQFVEMKHLNFRNLKDIEVMFPKSAMTCICGVSGSGKSTLLKHEIYERMLKSKEFDEVLLVDQNPIGRNSKSVVATYIGVMDDIRCKMAGLPDAIHEGLTEEAFSFNREIGQCPNCKGDGRIKLPFMENAFTICPDCGGKRYREQILKITCEEKSIYDILSMSVDEGMEFFREDIEIQRRLAMVSRVGLGYLKLGQSTTQLSGGEASRLKLASRLMEGTKNQVLYLLDEPTTGLHFSDIDHLLKLIRELVASGSTVVAIEHNKQFMRHCNWMIELGPEAGEKGGEVIYQGPTL